MYSNFAAELWSEFKIFLSPVDKEQAAELLVSILIDHDESVEDIKKSFRGDELIKNALLYHVDQDDSDDDYDDYDDYDNDPNEYDE